MTADDIAVKAMCTLAIGFLAAIVTVAIPAHFLGHANGQLTCIAVDSDKGGSE